ncbi:glycosyltransferase [Empedobacter stercoris]|uniref:glycosyltransferase n=1 Tax=Empedobacter stercoris TaxID=1628248 RepID=UPI001CE1331C|nr:glycosyltransferase [Empedobacter stercoris]MCA4776659.1 glycosyltransferase [Empedobacter stercoris]
MKKAIVIDWLDKYGGAERVIEKFNQIFQFDEVYTLTNIMKKDEFDRLFPQRNIQIHDTFLRVFKHRFRLLYFTFFWLIKRIKVNTEIDYFISSSHSVAKGVSKSRNNQIHISYFQARNSNYIWEEVDLYFGKLKYIFYPIIFILRKIDVNQAQKPDYIISNSKFVQKWVKETYNRDSEVIYPPINFENFELIKHKSDYYVIVGRIASIKRFDIVIDVFNNNNKKLIVIGDGEELSELKKRAKSNEIKFFGFQNAKVVGEYIGKAKAFIQVGVEGFGIAPLEAQACGTPVIAYAEGGVLETIVENKSGVFFHEQSIESLSKAIDKFEEMSFDQVFMRNHALRFSQENFEAKIKEFVESKTNML